MSHIIRAVFPRDGVMLRVRFNTGEYQRLDRSPVLIHGFRLTSIDNVLRVDSSSAFDQDFAGFIRIPFISGDDDVRLRTILGYMVVRSDGSLRFWNRPMCFRDNVLPRIYRADTRFCIMISFSIAFSTVFCILRSDHIVNVQEVKFLLSSMFIESNIITGNSSILVPYPTYQNIHDPTVQTIRARYFEISIPTVRNDDLNAVWLENDRDLVLAFYYYEWCVGTLPPYFGGVFNLIHAYVPPATAHTYVSIDSTFSSVRSVSEGKFPLYYHFIIFTRFVYYDGYFIFFLLFFLSRFQPDDDLTHSSVSSIDLLRVYQNHYSSSSISQSGTDLVDVAAFDGNEADRSSSSSHGICSSFVLHPLLFSPFFILFFIVFFS